MKIQLKKLLKNKTNCTIQHDGWTCGTCFFAISKKLNNKDWQAVLLTRGDYLKKDLDNLPKDINRSLNKVLRIIGGVHV